MFIQFRVESLELRVSGEFRVSGFKFQVSGFKWLSSLIGFKGKAIKKRNSR